MSSKTRHLLFALTAAGFCWLFQLLLLPAMSGLLWGFLVWMGVLTSLFLIPIKRAFGIWLVFSLAGLISLCANIFLCYSVVRVQGKSMIPALRPGDVLLVEDNALPEHLGIYVVHGNDTEIVKRLVGQPDDVLDVRFGRMFNGQTEVHPRLGGKPDDWNEQRPVRAGSRFYEPLKLGKDEYFFLSDNPQQGKDSRQTGPYKWKAVRGRVVLKLKPGLGGVD
ncbi:MAG: signal peptidase I [Planctomycetes bacterium]|nr:signal peptidase I [Planctomycetota bacterium]